MPLSPRAHFQWRLRTRTLLLGPRTVLMGILNVTPDSFSDGGRFFAPDAALNHALQMLDDGADILDLGGESTRPTSTPISPSEEQARVLPVLRAILAARPGAILSIDTYHAETGRLAVEAGAEIVTDVSGHLWDPAISATCAALACGNVLMHTRGRPQQWHTQPALVPSQVLPFVLRDLEARANAALAAGIAPESIVLDPGFGFGKILDENYPLLAHLDRLHALGFPILAGLSRKSFLTRTLFFAGPDAPHHTMSTNPGAPHLGVPGELARRGEHPGVAGEPATPQPAGAGAPHLALEMWDSTNQLPTTVANTAAILAGVHILRVHDIRPARQTATLADRLLAAAE
jgi:dihydropteroate synthase